MLKKQEFSYSLNNLIYQTKKTEIEVWICTYAISSTAYSSGEPCHHCTVSVIHQAVPLPVRYKGNLHDIVMGLLCVTFAFVFTNNFNYVQV